MPNMIGYNDWLFVKVPEDATDFSLPEQDFGSVLQFKIMSWHTEVLPPGSYHIIGKGDAIGWDEIVSYNHNVYGTWYRDYCNDKSNKKPQSVFPFDNPTESGHSLLRSLEMEPGTTLVLKKNEV